MSPPNRRGAEISTSLSGNKQPSACGALKPAGTTAGDGRMWTFDMMGEEKDTSFWLFCFIPQGGKLWPGGRKWPDEPFNPATRS